MFALLFRLSLEVAKRRGHDPDRTEHPKKREGKEHEPLLRHLVLEGLGSGGCGAPPHGWARSTTAEPDPPQRTGLVLSALLFVLRTTGLAKQPVEASPIEQEETPVRESCDCGGKEFRYREAVLDDGEWVLQCPECGHLDRLLWLSDENRSLLLGLARRRRRVQVRRT